MNLIDGRQKKTRKIVDLVLSLIGWIYLLAFVSQLGLLAADKFFGFPLFDRLMIIYLPFDAITTFYATVLIGLISFALLFGWRRYNLHRYGRLNRRKFPDLVTPKEIAYYFTLPGSEIEKMQDEKWVELDKSIV